MKNNANQIAESLIGWSEDVYGGGETLIEAAAMLRYQQSQIEALKTQLSYLESKVYGGTTQ